MVVRAARGWEDVAATDDLSYKFIDAPDVAFETNGLQGSSPCFRNGHRNPCVVLKLAGTETTSDVEIERTLSTSFEVDDVISSGFTKLLVLWVSHFHGSNRVLKPSSQSLSFATDDLDNYPCLQALGTKNLIVISCQNEAMSKCVQPGLNFWTSKGLHKAFQVFEDTQGAFLSAIRHEVHNGKHVYHEERPTSYIPVPSRLHSVAGPLDLPLSGLRFATKDVFDIQGLKTGVGSRSWYSFQPQSSETAPAISSLAAAGAMLVGKTKNTQFINGEDPQEWIDYSCPWNPRGDGYQNPDTSSSGAASAMAAYDWLDFTVGSDTCGSISCPAAAQGLFALRPSWGLIPCEGTFIISKYLDTAGLLCRDMDTICKVFEVWTSSISATIQPKDADDYPIRILYPWSSFPHMNVEVANVVDGFITALESATEVERHVIDLEDEWTTDDPSGTGLPMQNHLKLITGHLHLAGFDDTVGKFRKDYERKTGKAPYLDRVNTLKCELAQKLTHEDKEQMVVRQKIFAEWFERKILKSSNRGLLQSIMIWPMSPQEPQYRDNYPELSPHVDWKWDVDYTAPLAGLPHLTVPIGQYEYHSRISHRLEYLPISVGIVAPHGSDLALLRFVRKFLASSDFPSTVMTGPLAFEMKRLEQNAKV